MNLKGGADVNRLSDNNLAVGKNAAGDGYDIKLAKDLNLKDGSTTYTKPALSGTNTTIPYTVDTKAMVVVSQLPIHQRSTRTRSHCKSYRKMA